MSDINLMSSNNNQEKFLDIKKDTWKKPKAKVKLPDSKKNGLVDYKKHSKNKGFFKKMFSKKPKKPETRPKTQLTINKENISKNFKHTDYNKHNNNKYNNKDNKYKPAQKTVETLHATSQPTSQQKPETKKSMGGFNINLVPEKVKTQADLQKRVTVFVIVLAVCILLSGVVYFTLNKIVSDRQNELAEIETNTQELQEKITELRDDQMEINDFVELLRQAKILVDGHVFATHVFEFLQTNTLNKDINYAQLSFDADVNVINLKGETKDYETLAKQLLFLQSLTNEISEITLGEVVLEKSSDEQPEDMYTFNLTLDLGQEFLYK